MEIDTARDISRLMCFHASPKVVQSIKMLRADTNMGLIDAKNYLEMHATFGEDALFKKLCEDFVKDKRDLLHAARLERKRLKEYIDQLEAEIAQDDRIAARTAQREAAFAEERQNLLT